MIGKYDKKRKEQKKLLKELESIKSLLDDGELIDDDYSTLAETAQKKTVVEKPLVSTASETESEPLIADAIDDDYLISDELEIDLSAEVAQLDEEPDIPILQEMVIDDDSSKLTPGVLPGQQSLFEENAAEASEKINETDTQTSAPPVEKASVAAPAEKTAPAQQPEKPSSKTKAPKPNITENPFLPKHIRDRLNGTIDIPAYAHPNETLRSPYVAPQEFSTKPQNSPLESPFLSASTTSLDNQNQQEIIDALINEFMPKIESKLRIRLAQMLAKTPTK